MCNLKGQMDKGGYYVQMKRWMQKEGIMMWKSSSMDIEGIIISELKGQMDKGEHNDVEMKWWM